MSFRTEAATSAASPTDEELVVALPVVREAIRIMEAVCLRTGFASDDWAPSSSRYMGWLNRFGLWASAPLFRAWWPWLSPLHSRELAHFMANAFELGWNLEKDGSVRRLGKDPGEGYTWERWQLAQAGREARAPGDKTELYGFYLHLGGGQDLHAALVEISPQAGPPRSASWRHEDFFVAPGLWGLGVGEAFLQALLRELQARYAEARVTPAAGASATHDALYTGAGFRRERGIFVKDPLGEEKKDR